MDHIQAPAVLLSEGFSSGFTEFRDTGAFSDVTVVVGEATHHLHALLLARASAFFATCLSSNSFREGTERVVRLQLDDPYGALPSLLDYIYTGRLSITEETAGPLLSLARQLMMPEVEEAARGALEEWMTPQSCMHYLRQAVRCNDDELAEAAVAVAAQGFPLVFSSDLSGLPPGIVASILSHPELDVQCEEQVLTFVLTYVRGTSLEPEAAEELFRQVRYTVLPSERFAELHAEPFVPRDVLAEAALARMVAMAGVQGLAAGGAAAAAAAPASRLGGWASDGEAMEEEEQGAAVAAAPLYRPTYCCELQYGLPGGLPYVDLPCGPIWEELAECMKIQVSGVSEGRPRNVLSAEPRAFFSTNESEGQPPWIEVGLPANVTLLSLAAYCFQHGHHRPSFFRIAWRSQAGTASCNLPGSTFVDIDTRAESNFDIWPRDVRKAKGRKEFRVACAPLEHGLPGFRVLRLLGSGRQQDGVRRLSVRALRLEGVVRVNLLVGSGLRVTCDMVARARAAAAAPG